VSYMNGIGSSQPFPSVPNDITSSSAGRLSKADSDASAVSQQSNRGVGTETASLSSTAGIVANALSGSDVRMDRVSSLQQAIASGTYNVPASAVAGKMLNALMN
jgi:negative regulator of flagellin synthesis FlgM